MTFPQNGTFSFLRFLFSTTLLMVLAAPQMAWSQEEDEEDDDLRSGLIAAYSDTGGSTIKRVDRAIAFRWQDALPDDRLQVGKFSARWSGYLKSQVPGKYRLHAYASGKVRIQLNGKTVIDQTARSPIWLDSLPLEIPFDYHRLDVEFEKSGRDARLALYWSGPGFQLEPLTPRQFYHDSNKTPADDFARGQQLARALRCTACHTRENDAAAIAAPDLTHLAGNVKPAWLVDWLAGDGSNLDGKQNTSIARRMPHFGLSLQEAQQLATFLLSGEQPEDEPESMEGDAEAGEKLLLTVGCLACHRVGKLGQSGLFDGGDLTHIADKRPAGFFVQWLSKPEKINPRHRMPVFKITAGERRNLTAYLSGLHGKAKKQIGELPTDVNPIEAGRKLYVRHGCAACHQRDDAPKVAFKPSPLSVRSKWQRTCAGQPNANEARPGYRLSKADQRALTHYFSTRNQQQPSAPTKADGRRLLAENNCLSCHARDGVPGLAARLPAVSTAHGQLASLLPAMTPPPLDSVGDKLHDEALLTAIGRKARSRRPWLAVRMPRFNLTEEQLEALAEHLIEADRIPPRPKTTASPVPEKKLLQLAGPRLVTTDGFGCTSCHQVGKVMPVKAPLNARGPNLSMLQERIRPAWFDRWVRNPARIVPRMEMPSVQLAVRGVMQENLDHQLAAVWHILNQPGFQPPEPNPVRVVRRSGQSGKKERAVMLTDVLMHGNRTYVKPFLIGLPNRHSVLLDLETNRLAGWWIGDVARQRTKGKTWFWEAAGGDLLPVSESSGSELVLDRGKKMLKPMTVRQFPTEIDSWRHDEQGGIVFNQRLRFPARQSDQLPLVLRVKQNLYPITAEASQPTNQPSGFRRHVVVAGAESGDVVRLRIVRQTDAVKVTTNTITLQGPGAATIRLADPKQGRFEVVGDEVFIAQTVAQDRSTVRFQLIYQTALPVDRYLPPQTEIEPPKPLALNVVPGFEAIRLPLADEFMPTALAWRPDGTMVVTSLKGRVWLGRDTDGDSLEDTLRPFSDELAAPFGAAAHGDYIDVINKYALLRLYDDDRDGRADRTETLASGWGHTTDYHDWAVGLPQDEKGNYYAAFPCQQDKRSPAAAHLRGKVVKLVPRQPTKDDPRLFGIELQSGGHRFPIGIARDRHGELFVTDNQGNYNPFNELNHVIPGSRYGFLNLLERKPGFRPPLTPPAIDIPHPWTRSVNGICFLDTPKQVKQRLGRDLFGPLEGHLIGCEYDTRRLVRMSLQRVGDTYQGAAYPFSYDKPKEGPPLLGPLACGLAPDGDLYVGSIRDSGWGGANNIGSLVRLRPKSSTLPAGIAEVQARKDRFVIDFTAPVDSKLAADAANYAVASYTRVSTPAYGGPDQNRRNEKVDSIRLLNDGRRVEILLTSPLRAGYVYEFRLKNLAGAAFFPNEAHYTLRRIPE